MARVEAARERKIESQFWSRKIRWRRMFELKFTSDGTKADRMVQEKHKINLDENNDPAIDHFVANFLTISMGNRNKNENSLSNM